MIANIVYSKSVLIKIGFHFGPIQFGQNLGFGSSRELISLNFNSHSLELIDGVDTSQKRKFCRSSVSLLIMM